ncbi:MAG TPA: flavodoxin [Actinomycetota bacterium]|nr:flavodoxin [Actinomycetota bacterium]
MKIIVVYESMFGNTQIIGQAIADGLADLGQVTSGNVDEISAESARDADLIVVGGPTHAHGMARMSTRFPKVDNPKYAPSLPGTTVLRSWLDLVPKGSGRCAAFDTRFDKPAWLTGSAAKKIAKRLKAKGFAVLAIESFFVQGGDGPLAEGERARATEWGHSLASMIASVAAA